MNKDPSLGNELEYFKKYKKKTKRGDSFFSNWQYILLDFLIVLVGIFGIVSVVSYLNLPVLNVIGFIFAVWYIESEYSFYNRKTGISDLIRAKKVCEQRLKRLIKSYEKL